MTTVTRQLHREPRKHMTVPVPSLKQSRSCVQASRGQPCPSSDKVAPLANMAWAPAECWQTRARS